MIILLDADGPLFDLTGASVRAVNDHWDMDHYPEHWTQWDAHFLDRRHHQWMKDALWRDPEFWLRLPTTAGAVFGVEKLRKAGHDIHVVTSSFESCKGWEHARRAALRTQFDIDAKFVTVTAQKHLVCGDVFVDDKIENVVAWGARWQRQLGAAYLYDLPHNRVAPGIGSSQRVDWKKIEELFAPEVK